MKQMSGQYERAAWTCTPMQQLENNLSKVAAPEGRHSSKEEAIRCGLGSALAGKSKRMFACLCVLLQQHRSSGKTWRTWADKQAVFKWISLHFFVQMASSREHVYDRGRKIKNAETLCSELACRTGGKVEFNIQELLYDT